MVLQQAPSAGHQKLKTDLFPLGFRMSNADSALFFVEHNNCRVYAGFLFHAPRAGTGRCTGRADACPFLAVRRSSEFEELSSL